MKFIVSQISYFFQNRGAKRNIRYLVVFLLVMIAMITAYSVIFHWIMAYEGQDHSWITGFYWVLTVMSTLGFGDITFDTDLGKIFSIIVLLSGVVFLLILLPFTFIQFFYSPWIEAQNKSRALRELEPYISGHVIFTSYDEITQTLIEKFSNFGIYYIVLQGDLQKALELYDMGVNVGYGAIDNPDTYKKMRVDRAALVFASNTDEINSNIAFTIREISEKAKIITTADSPDSVDILGLAGSNMVLEPRKMIGEAFGRRTMGGNALSSEIGRFENLIIAEAPAMGTPLVGKTLAGLDLRNKIGINVAGFWDHGDFIDARPDYVIQNSTVLVLIGTEKSIDLYNEMFVIFRTNSHPVLILGSGRVGEYASSMLEKRDIDFVFVEKDADNVSNKDKTIIGNAADLETLEKAGINEAPSVIISTSSDDMNIYLTIYCRKLRPDIQIISRANSDTNISTLKRAGSDLIMSYPSLTANAVFNFMKKSKILMISEGFDIFSAKVPKSMIGKSLLNARIREETGCNVLAIKQENEIYTNPDPNHIFDHGTSLLMVGSKEAETNFLKLFT